MATAAAKETTRPNLEASKALDRAYDTALAWLKQRRTSFQERHSTSPQKGAIYQKLVLASDPGLLYDWSHGKKELELPKFSEMDNSQWRQNYGPQLCRALAKIDGLIAKHQGQDAQTGSMLPYETESQLNMTVSFGSDALVQRGNILLPYQVNAQPTVSFCVDNEALGPRQDSYLSLFLFDLDYPSADSSHLEHYCLWAVGNLPISINKQTILDPGSHDNHTADTWLQYQPPHPQRGTGYHRYLCLLVSHPEKLGSSSGSTHVEFLPQPSSDPQTRYCDLATWPWSSSTGPISIVSYSWFRSCWTKDVDLLDLDASLPHRHRMIFGRIQIQDGLPIDSPQS